jgi:hypothetical protein
MKQYLESDVLRQKVDVEGSNPCSRSKILVADARKRHRERAGAVGVPSTPIVAASVSAGRRARRRQRRSRRLLRPLAGLGPRAVAPFPPRSRQAKIRRTGATIGPHRR